MYNKSHAKTTIPFASDKKSNSILNQEKEIDQTNSTTNSLGFGMVMPNLLQKTDSYTFGAPSSKPAPSAIKFPKFEPSLYSTQHNKPANTISFSTLNSNSAPDFNFDYNLPFSTIQNTNSNPSSSLLPLSNPTLHSSILPSANPLLSSTQKHSFIGDTTQSKLNPINLPIAETEHELFVTNNGSLNKPSISTRLFLEIQEQKQGILQLNKKK